MLDSWQHADISDNPLYGGDLSRALRAVTARTLLLPVDSDLYFHPDDNRVEAALLPNAELRVLDSSWGNCAGGPARNVPVSALIDRAIRELLGERSPLR